MSRTKASLLVLRADFERAAQRYARAMDAFTAAKRPGRGRCMYLDLNHEAPIYACAWIDDGIDTEDLCERCREKRLNYNNYKAATRELQRARCQFRRFWKRWQEARKP